jgi:hypothetical protein
LIVSSTNKLNHRNTTTITTITTTVSFSILLGDGLEVPTWDDIITVGVYAWLSQSQLPLLLMVLVPLERDPLALHRLAKMPPPMLVHALFAITVPHDETGGTPAFCHPIVTRTHRREPFQTISTSCVNRATRFAIWTPSKKHVDDALIPFGTGDRKRCLALVIFEEALSEPPKERIDHLGLIRLGHDDERRVSFVVGNICIGFAEEEIE